MARVSNRLTTATVKAASPGKYSDGSGLWLHKRPDGGGQWFLRVSIHGRRREMGLGSIDEVSLKEARQAAERHRSLVRQGMTRSGSGNASAARRSAICIVYATLR